MADLGGEEGTGGNSNNAKPPVTMLCVCLDYSSSLINSGEEICGKYDGELDGAGCRHGKGKMTWKGGDVYEGDWKVDRMDGWGMFKYVTTGNGSTYEGEFKEGQRDGKGTSRFLSGDVYVGFWIADEREGNGQYRFVDGSVENKKSNMIGC
jgi:hypothetical protein